ncbi:hypothetical protein C360_03667 [Cryptococcus neoformans Bt15]|nr:hypothetical protein C360_03667 [Cryptococcus neoformans var. grubii Bt15]
MRPSFSISCGTMSSFAPRILERKNPLARLLLPQASLPYGYFLIQIHGNTVLIQITPMSLVCAVGFSPVACVMGLNPPEKAEHLLPKWPACPNWRNKTSMSGMLGPSVADQI